MAWLLLVAPGLPIGHRLTEVGSNCFRLSLFRADRVEFRIAASVRRSGPVVASEPTNRTSRMQSLGHTCRPSKGRRMSALCQRVITSVSIRVHDSSGCLCYSSWGLVGAQGSSFTVSGNSGRLTSRNRSSNGRRVRVAIHAWAYL